MKINEQAREALIGEVDGLTDEELNKKSADDQWSIKQVLEHLYLMEAAVTKTIQTQLETGEVVIAEEKPIELTINRTMKVNSPDFSLPSESFVTLEELKVNLAATHQDLKELFESTNDKQLEDRAYLHPVFGQMSLKQWIPFVGYHEMRHIEQIKEVKSKLGLK
ncbi:DinB family protein [Virgibacillus profundi]|uniref:DinB family protein n=1 Tax=Virgibacillus profundi TaxID=2024555 RepID=UPI0013FE0486|nr:DinB family protein [Virgibacillus profundi]